MKQALAMVFLAAAIAAAGCAENPAGETSRTPRDARRAALPALKCPKGWGPWSSASGVMLCSRVSPITQKSEYLQLVSLARGAKVINLVEGPSATVDVPSPQFRKHEMEDWWTISGWATRRRFCVVNGQYFSNKAPVPLFKNRWQYSISTHAFLSFPVVNEGWVLGAGADVNTQANLYALTWNSTRAQYDRYRGTLNDFRSAYYNLRSPYAVVGTGVLFESGTIARTYIGYLASDPSTIAIFSTPKATAQQAKDVLDAANITGAVQLDGGDSGAIRCGTSWYNPHGRAVPHALLTIAAP